MKITIYLSIPAMLLCSCDTTNQYGPNPHHQQDIQDQERREIIRHRSFTIDGRAPYATDNIPMMQETGRTSMF